MANWRSAITAQIRHTRSMQIEPRILGATAALGRAALLGLVWLLALMALLAWIILDLHPEVRPVQQQSYLSATRSLIDRNVRANPLRTAEVRSIAMTEDDLTAVANFILLRKRLDGHAVADIHGKRLDFRSSIKLPLDWPTLYLNLKIVTDDAEPSARVQQLKAGRLALPQPLVSALQFAVINWTPLRRYTRIFAPLIHEVRIADERLRITINWNRDTLTQMQQGVSDEASKARLIAYQKRLTDLLFQYQSKRYISLSLLIQPLFALAQDRSRQADSDPVVENRALILVLGAYANGRKLATDGLTLSPPQKSLLLNRRIDTAQHFMASAALAVSGHRTFADLIGLAKEINDTHSGSGFSFTDLAADRAGALFGKFVTKSRDHALRAQAMLSQSGDEMLYMPNLRGLPENLGPTDFVNRFRNIDSPEFETLKRNIEERIQSCALYR